MSTEQYGVEILNRFTALENLDTEVDINRDWENIRENIKIPAKKSLTMETQNYYITGNKQNSRGYRLQV
jgi:hypothetical protein